MKEDTKSAVTILIAATGLIVVSLSVSFPVYHVDSVEVYADGGNLVMDEEDQTPGVLTSFRFLLFSGIIFGWMFLAASLLGGRILSVVVGWMSIALIFVSAAYLVSRLGDAVSNDGIPGATFPSVGGFSSGVAGILVGAVVLAIAVYIKMADALRKKADSEPEGDGTPFA